MMGAGSLSPGWSTSRNTNRPVRMVMMVQGIYSVYIPKSLGSGGQPYTSCPVYFLIRTTTATATTASVIGIANQIASGPASSGSI